MSISNITTKIINIFDHATSKVSRKLFTNTKNNLVRIAKSDSFVTAPKEISAAIKPKLDCLDTSAKELSASIKPEIKIILQRATTDSDLREIQKIDLEAFAQTDPVPTNFGEYKERISDLTSYVVKNNENKVVGYYQLEPIKNETLYINSMGIVKEHRKTRTAYHALNAMYDEIKKFAEEKQVKKLALHADAEDKALFNLHKKWGFEIKHIEPNYFINGNDAHYMELDVAKKKQTIIQPKSIINEPVLNQKITETQFSKLKRQDPNEIYEINVERLLSVADTPEKVELAETLIQLKDKDNKYIVPSPYVYGLIKKSNTPERLQLAKKLLLLKDKDNNYLVEPMYISSILESATTPEIARLKFNFIQKLSKLSDKNNKQILPIPYIYSLSIKVKTLWQATVKYNLINKLKKLKNDIGQTKYGFTDITNIVSVVNTPKESQLAEKLAKITKIYKRFSNTSENIAQLIMELNTPEQKQLAMKLADLKDKNNYRILQPPYITMIARTADTPKKAQFKFDLAQKLVQLKIFNHEGLCLVVTSAKTAKIAMIQYNLAKKLVKQNPSLDIARVLLAADTPDKAKLAEKLSQLNYQEGASIFYATEMEKMISSTNTPQKTRLKSALAEKLVSIKNKYGKQRIPGCVASTIVSSADTPQNAAIKFNLSKKIVKLIGQSGFETLGWSNIEKVLSTVDTKEQALLAEKIARLRNSNLAHKIKSDDWVAIVLSADTSEKALYKADLAFNKNFIKQIGTLDSDIGKKLYVEILKHPTAVDSEKIGKLYNYLCENKINLQQYGEEKITNQSIISLFDTSMLKAANLLDHGTIKYATKLKYKQFENFISNTSKLTDKLDKDTYSKLQENLSKLSTPDLKFERLQSIIALNNADSESATIKEAIDLIKSPRTTVEQINLANKIFTSNKPYQEQIQEFFEEFNVVDDKKESLKKLFEEQRLILAPKTQNSAENQLMILDKKIQDVKSNAKIPENKKSAYVAQLEKQKAELTAKPQSATAKMSDKALALLAQQIEHHINRPKNNTEFNNFINSQIYKKLNIEPTPELLKTLDFDKKYLPDLFTGLSDDDFSEQFTKLIKLVNEKPKPLSELRETLEHNKQTKKLFEQNGINYQKWIKFDKNSHLPFSCETNLQEAIRGVELNIVNELNGDLFKSVEKINKVQTDKILQALSDAGYKVDEESITKIINRDGQKITQKDLEKIVDIFKDTINKNAEFWDKPLFDTHSENLKNELIDHLLKGRKKEVADLATMANVKMDLTMKLSDDDDISRNLFLGNHVGCCTSVGGSNAFAAPQHLMNTFVRGMEIVDKNGNSYGNSMCYFAKIDNKLSFVIDSFEANGKLGGNQAVTDAIVEYAKQVTKEMGKPDIPIYFGPNFNKINMSNLKLVENKTIGVIGKTDELTYIDAIGGNQSINELHNYRNLYTTTVC